MTVIGIGIQLSRNKSILFFSKSALMMIHLFVKDNCVFNDKFTEFCVIQLL